MKGNKKYIVCAFGGSLLLGILSLGYFILKEGGLFTLFADFNVQQIPFNMLANSAVKSGDINWNWNIDIGSNFIGAFSFYNLGSPFFWITLFFPAHMFPYLAGAMYILKYAVAGATAYLYLQMFVKNKNYAVLGGFLYAFSGFQATNLLFNHFHDVVAFFPLLLFGIEKLLNENKRGIFGFAVFLNALLNYYFFFGEVIFLIIYFLVKWFPEKNRWSNMGKCILEGILGVGMAGILLIPSAAFVLQNPRVGEHISGISALVYDWKKYLHILRAFFFPAEIMSYQSSIYIGDWSSCAAYLPMVSVSLVIAYIYNVRKNWLSKLLAVCFIITFIPALNNIFSLFNKNIYHRWFYIFILFMALASVKVLEDRRQYRIKGPVMVTFAAIAILTLIVKFYNPANGDTLLFREKEFWIITVISAAGVLATYVIVFKVRDKQYLKVLYLSISIFCVGTTFFDCFLYRKSANLSSRDYYKAIESTKDIQYPDQRYRFISDNNLVNMTVPIAGTGSWCSTVNGSIFEFYESLGLERIIDNPDGPDGTEELLAGKYYIENAEDENKNPIQVVETGGQKKYVYENEEALPVGVTYDTYMKKSDFEKLEPGIRALAMIKTLVVSDADVNEVYGKLSEYNETDDGKIASYNKKSDIESHMEESANDFVRSNKGFRLNLNADSDKYAFFSVPYDKGWSAVVNGNSCEILNINGLMAIPVEEGDNNISFIYEVPYLKAGIYVTVLSGCIWIVYTLLSVYSERRLTNVEKK